MNPEDNPRDFDIHNECGLAYWNLEQEMIALKKTHESAIAEAVKVATAKHTNALLEIRDRWVPALKSIVNEPDKVLCDIGQIEMVLARIVPRSLYPERAQGATHG